MDAFVAFCDDGIDSEQAWSLRCPSAGGAGAVFFSGKDDERDAGGLIFLGGVEDRHFLLRGKVAGVSAFDVDKLVAKADVGEGAANHDFVIAAARAVGVEVGGFNAVFLQIFSRGAIFLDGAGGGDVVGGDAVAEDGEDARVFDVLDGRGFQAHAIEVGGASDVGGILFPGVGLAFGNGKATPAGVAFENFRIAF